MLASTAPRVRPLLRGEAPSASVVVITDVDGILRHADIRALAEAQPALDALAGSILVLCSSRSADELRAMQRQLGIRHPFISDGGAALHIPTGYFYQGADASAETLRGIPATRDDGYETIDFGVRRLGHALRLVIALFRTCPVSPLIVGIGFEWRDRVLLREVDVPVVIRDAVVDQSTLLRNVPQAYLTTACGDDGLLEAVFGHSSVGRA
jgi:predicted mannosyl-3-phosphoglycerate phosphatase (HAD superfamily)